MVNVQTVEVEQVEVTEQEETQLEPEQPMVTIRLPMGNLNQIVTPSIKIAR